MTFSHFQRLFLCSSLVMLVTGPVITNIASAKVPFDPSRPIHLITPLTTKNTKAFYAPGNWAKGSFYIQAKSSIELTSKAVGSMIISEASLPSLKLSPIGLNLFGHHTGMNFWGANGHQCEYDLKKALESITLNVLSRITHVYLGGCNTSAAGTYVSQLQELLPNLQIVLGFGGTLTPHMRWAMYRIQSELNQSGSRRNTTLRSYSMKVLERLQYYVFQSMSGNLDLKSRKKLANSMLKITHIYVRVDNKFYRLWLKKDRTKRPKYSSVSTYSGDFCKIAKDINNEAYAIIWRLVDGRNTGGYEASREQYEQAIGKLASYPELALEDLVLNESAGQYMLSKAGKTLLEMLIHGGGKVELRPGSAQMSAYKRIENLVLSIRECGQGFHYPTPKRMVFSRYLGTVIRNIRLCHPQTEKSKLALLFDPATMAMTKQQFIKALMPARPVMLMAPTSLELIRYLLLSSHSLELGPHGDFIPGGLGGGLYPIKGHRYFNRYSPNRVIDPIVIQKMENDLRQEYDAHVRKQVQLHVHQQHFQTKRQKEELRSEMEYKIFSETYFRMSETVDSILLYRLREKRERLFRGNLPKLYSQIRKGEKINLDAEKVGFTVDTNQIEWIEPIRSKKDCSKVNDFQWVNTKFKHHDEHVDLSIFRKFFRPLNQETPAPTRDKEVHGS